MTDVNKLKIEMTKKNFNLTDLARAIEMPISTLSRRMKSARFNTDEASKIIEVLELEEPEEIFFAKQLT